MSLGSLNIVISGASKKLSTQGHLKKSFRCRIKVAVKKLCSWTEPSWVHLLRYVGLPEMYFQTFMCYRWLDSHMGRLVWGADHWDSVLRTTGTQQDLDQQQSKSKRQCDNTHSGKGGRDMAIWKGGRDGELEGQKMAKPLFLPHDPCTHHSCCLWWWTWVPDWIERCLACPGCLYGVSLREEWQIGPWAEWGNPPCMWAALSNQLGTPMEGRSRWGKLAHTLRPSRMVAVAALDHQTPSSPFNVDFLQQLRGRVHTCAQGRIIQLSCSEASSILGWLSRFFGL